MKKSLIALALMGAFSSAAVAQSNVTLYGILDVNYMWQELPTVVGTGTATRIQQESVDGINSGHQSGSRWGLRGSEALGGGLSAIFTIEGGFDLDRGTMRRADVCSVARPGLACPAAWVPWEPGPSRRRSPRERFVRHDRPHRPVPDWFRPCHAGNTFYSMNALRQKHASCVSRRPGRASRAASATRSTSTAQKMPIPTPTTPPSSRWRQLDGRPVLRCHHV